MPVACLYRTWTCCDQIFEVQIKDKVPEGSTFIFDPLMSLKHSIGKLACKNWSIYQSMQPFQYNTVMWQAHDDSISYNGINTHALVSKMQIKLINYYYNSSNCYHCYYHRNSLHTTKCVEDNLCLFVIYAQWWCQTVVECTQKKDYELLDIIEWIWCVIFSL